MRKSQLDYCEKVGGDETTGMYAVRGNPWNHAMLALAEFPDGKIRTVRLNESADGFFSWSGRTSYKKFTVKCFVTCEDGRLKGHYDTSALQEVMSRR